MFNFTWFFFLDKWQKFRIFFGTLKQKQQQKQCLVRLYVMYGQHTMEKYFVHTWKNGRNMVLCICCTKYKENPQFCVMIWGNSILRHHLTLTKVSPRLDQLLLKSIFDEIPTEFWFFFYINFYLGNRNTQQCTKKISLKIFHLIFHVFLTLFMIFYYLISNTTVDTNPYYLTFDYLSMIFIEIFMKK